MFSCCVSDAFCYFQVMVSDDLPASQTIISCSHYCRPHSCNLNFPIYLLKVHKTWQNRDSNSDHKQRVTDCGTLYPTYPVFFREKLCTVLLPKSQENPLHCSLLPCYVRWYVEGWTTDEIEETISCLWCVCERPKISWTVSSDTSFVISPTDTKWK